MPRRRAKARANGNAKGKEKQRTRSTRKKIRDKKKQMAETESKRKEAMIERAHASAARALEEQIRENEEREADDLIVEAHEKLCYWSTDNLLWLRGSFVTKNYFTLLGISKPHADVTIEDVRTHFNALIRHYRDERAKLTELRSDFSDIDDESKLKQYITDLDSQGYPIKRFDEMIEENDNHRIIGLPIIGGENVWSLTDEDDNRVHVINNIFTDCDLQHIIQKAEVDKFFDLEVRDYWGVSINAERFKAPSSYLSRFPKFVNDVCRERSGEYNGFERNGELFKMYFVSDYRLVYKYIADNFYTDITKRYDMELEQDPFIVRLFYMVNLFEELFNARKKVEKLSENIIGCAEESGGNRLFNFHPSRDYIRAVQNKLFCGYTDGRLEKLLVKDRDNSLRKPFEFLPIFQCWESQQEIIKTFSDFEAWLYGDDCGVKKSLKTRDNALRAFKSIWTDLHLVFYDPFNKSVVYALRGVADILAKTVHAEPRPAGQDKWTRHEVGSYKQRVRFIESNDMKPGYAALQTYLEAYVESTGVEFKHWYNYQWNYGRIY